MAFKMRGFKMMPDTESSVSQDQAKSQVGDGTNNIVPQTLVQLQEYNNHMANSPKFKKGDSIGGHFNTYMKKILHNAQAPQHPYRLGGGGGLDLIGGRGLAKGAMNAIKYIFKSGGKTAVKKSLKS